MALETAAIRPARGHLCNVRTGEMMEFLLNPTEFSEAVDVEYQQIKVPGLGHRVLQYDSTANATVPFEFYLDKYFAAETFTDDPDIQNFKRFLQALTVPSRGAEDVLGGAPPRALVIWPNVLSLTCVVRRLEFRYQRFDFFGDVLMYTARTNFEEIRDVRMASEELREVGSLRGGV